MRFYKHLYIGDTVTNPAKIKRKLKLHAGVSAYVIALCEGPDQLEIFHGGYLKQKYYRYHPPVIIGIASDHSEAVGIVLQITQECLDATNGCNLKEYLKQKCKMDKRGV